MTYENTPTVYNLTAKFEGPVSATLQAHAEMEANFTNIDVNVSIFVMEIEESFFLSWVTKYAINAKANTYKVNEFCESYLMAGSYKQKTIRFAYGRLLLTFNV